MTDRIEKIETLRDNQYSRMVKYTNLMAKNLSSPKNHKYFLEYFASKKAYKTSLKCLKILKGLD